MFLNLLKTISEVRKAFWEAHPEFKSDYRVKKRQNDYYTDIRCSFVDYIDLLERTGSISESLAQSVTL